MVAWCQEIKVGHFLTQKNSPLGQNGSREKNGYFLKIPILNHFGNFRNFDEWLLNPDFKLVIWNTRDARPEFWIHF